MISYNLLRFKILTDFSNVMGQKVWEPCIITTAVLFILNFAINSVFGRYMGIMVKDESHAE